MKDFHDRTLKWTFPNKNLTSVCYGGSFAVPAYRLLDLSKKTEELRVIKLLETILSRKSASSLSIEEHYVERTWAGLLSQPLTKNEVESLYKISGGKFMNIRRAIFGQLTSEEMCAR